MWKFWEKESVRRRFPLPLFLSVAVGFVFLLYWAVDFLPLSIFGKLVVAGIVSLVFLISGIFLFIRDWRRKIVEEYVASKKGRKKDLILS